jgi:hypothetical protein
MDLLVRRDALTETRLDDPPPAPLRAGQARLRVDAFALTANNITYAVFGGPMRYWDFFPAPEGWGRVPVWGFADVVESEVDGLAEGTRVYGYLPMSHEVVVEPTRVDERGFVDGAAHRAPMASAYNHYARVDTDPSYDPAHEDALMLLRPLVTTAFLLDDFLDDHDRFGAATVVLSSASSKTAASTAFFLAERPGVEVVGLTSAANVAFTEALDVYDRVVTYDDLAADGGVLGDGPAVFIDVAGSADVRAAVHHHFGDGLVQSVVVGGTHWDEVPSGAGASGGPLPGAAPALFFAPDQVKKRNADWGGSGYEERMAAASRRTVAWADGWLQVERSLGPEAVEATYLAMVAGSSSPSVGHVLSMWT